MRGLKATPPLDLGGRPHALAGHVHVLAGKRLAAKLLVLDQLEQRVVHAHSEPQLQLALRAPDIGCLDDPLHRRLERAVAREADALVAPEPVGVEVR